MPRTIPYRSQFDLRHKNTSISLTQTIPTGPAGIEYDSVEAMDGKSPIILNAIPKTSIIVKFRRNSCLYPSFAETIVRVVVSVLPESLTYLEWRYHLRWLDCSPVLTLWKPCARLVESPYCRRTDVQTNARNANRKKDTRSGKGIAKEEIITPPPVILNPSPSRMAAT